MVDRHEIVAEARARVAAQIERQRAALETAPDHIRERLAPYPFGLPSREDCEVAKATGYSSNEVLHLGKDFCREHPANEVSETVAPNPADEPAGSSAKVAHGLRSIGATYVEDEGRWYHPQHRQQWLGECPAEYLGWIKGYDRGAAARTQANQIIGEVEERFPDWRNYRDLIDCIDCTLHVLRNRRG